MVIGVWFGVGLVGFGYGYGLVVVGGCQSNWSGIER